MSRFIAVWHYSDGSGVGMVPQPMSEDTVRFIQWYRRHFTMDPGVTIYRLTGADETGLMEVKQPPEAHIGERNKIDV